MTEIEVDLKRCGRLLTLDPQTCENDFTDWLRVSGIRMPIIKPVPPRYASFSFKFTDERSAVLFKLRWL